MRYYTRRWVRHLSELAPIREIVTLATEDSVGAFVSQASQSHAIASGVKSLHMNIKAGLASLRALRRCLVLLRHLEDLELHLVGLSHSSWVHVLRSANFNDLENLSTNAPHSVLCHFLPKATNVQHLRLLSYCGDPCQLDNISFPHLTDVTAAAACVIPVTNQGNVERLSVVDLGPEGITAFPRMLKSLASSTSTLTLLHIDFDPSDRDILKRISEVAPNVTALKLIEKESLPQGRSLRQRHPWNDSSEWRNDLRRFPRLHRFLLRTPMSLVRTPSIEHEELALLHAWTCIKSVPHPSLMYVTLWYLAGSPSATLKSWKREAGNGINWVLLLHAIPPEWDQFT
ncbi:hypothetical protein PISMIDRAFT_8551 [Pisolithus microcarpus 441]|uniref:Uncharacterized protein n=1 Tax=Pisolithus microcarpus 441 TaxID=765257 RepID=A0A0C9ZMD0_9AGAM|nr:hypothetical protein PISMIDRAFT_8551 [Pisolithus microcarpus 441]